MIKTFLMTSGPFAPKRSKWLLAIVFILLSCGFANSGEIVRSKAAVRAFKIQTGFPHGRPGFVIDHVVPLACGGLDKPINMQWQTIQEGLIKDQWERKHCEDWSGFTWKEIE